MSLFTKLFFEGFTGELAPTALLIIFSILVIFAVVGRHSGFKVVNVLLAIALGTYIAFIVWQENSDLMNIINLVGLTVLYAVIAWVLDSIKPSESISKVGIIVTTTLLHLMVVVVLAAQDSLAVVSEHSQLMSQMQDVCKTPAIEHEVQICWVEETKNLYLLKSTSGQWTSLDSELQYAISSAEYGIKEVELVRYRIDIFYEDKYYHALLSTSDPGFGLVFDAGSTYRDGTAMLIFTLPSFPDYLYYIAVTEDNIVADDEFTQLGFYPFEIGGFVNRAELYVSNLPAENVEFGLGDFFGPYRVEYTTGRYWRETNNPEVLYTNDLLGFSYPTDPTLLEYTVVEMDYMGIRTAEIVPRVDMGFLSTIDSREGLPILLFADRYRMDLHEVRLTPFGWLEYVYHPGYPLDLLSKAEFIGDPHNCPMEYGGMLEAWFEGEYPLYYSSSWQSQTENCRVAINQYVFAQTNDYEGPYISYLRVAVSVDGEWLYHTILTDETEGGPIYYFEPPQASEEGNITIGMYTLSDETDILSLTVNPDGTLSDCDPRLKCD